MRTSSSNLAVSSAQRRRLHGLLAQPDDGTRRAQRIAIVLMSAEGLSGARIAAAVGTTTRTVARVRARWRAAGIASLDDGVRTGRPAQVTATYVETLVALVNDDPRRHGYAFTRWTAPRLAAHLARTTGIGVSARWVAELLHEQGLVWRRSKRTIRHLQDPAAMTRARRALRRLKKRPPSPTPRSSSGSAMACASTGCP